MNPEINPELIPQCKSWTNKHLFLDALAGHDEDYDIVHDFIHDTNNDIEAGLIAAQGWVEGRDEIFVGESATVYRMYLGASWKFDRNVHFAKTGTLLTREVCQDPSVLEMSFDELQKIDHGTSQWPTVQALLGNPKRAADPGEQLAITYEAIEDWQQCREGGQLWIPRRDAALTRHAGFFFDLLRGRNPVFTAKSAEDFAVLGAFGFMSPEELAIAFPSLPGHETNRPAELACTLEEYKKGEKLSTKEHRLIPAFKVKGLFENVEVEFEHPEVVDKSWPQIWDLLEEIQD